MATSSSEPLPRRYHELAPSAPEEGLDLVEVFGQNTEIEMEIGFGRGSFLLERAAAKPDVGLLGLEIKRKWAYRVQRRVERLGLSRVCVIGADCRLLLPRIRPDGCLSRAYLHFPDPWWKKRHAKRRLLDEGLLDELGRLLRPGGEFFMQTDVEARGAGVAQLREHPHFELTTESGFVEDNPFGARSNREKRAEQDGLPVHRILARRR